MELLTNADKINNTKKQTRGLSTYWITLVDKSREFYKKKNKTNSIYYTKKIVYLV